MANIQKKYIGLLGGSFDPAHKGHLGISKIALKKLKLKKIYWVITKKNPFKNKTFHSLDARIKYAKKIARLLKFNNKLKFYKKLESIDSIIDLNKIKENLKDRCGKFTEEVKALFINKEICIKLANTGVTSIKSSKEISIISFHKKINEKLLNKIINLSLKNPSLYNITKEEKFIINISENNAMIRRANILKLINEII